MTSMLAVPVVLGVAAVLQSGLNRQIARSWGFPVAAGLSGAVLVLVALITITVLRLGGQPAPFTGAVDGPSWWWLLPGVFGFCLVVGLPWAFGKLGASTVFVWMVAGQLIAGLVWDVVSGTRVLGAVTIVGTVLALAGAALVTLGT